MNPKLEFLHLNLHHTIVKQIPTCLRLAFGCLLALVQLTSIK